MCFYLKAHTQNLVPNPSFELYDTCPFYTGYLNYTQHWFNANTGSSDFFHSCSAGIEVDIPTNNMGNQFARTGDSYVGIICKEFSNNYREYIEVELINPLISDQEYCVEFYVSLGDIFSLAVSSIGVYFSEDSLLVNNWNAITFVSPQIENDSTYFLTNKVNWMKVFGTFTAQGGEKFMIIGNFRNPQNTHSISVPGGVVADMAYYYIDDISVTACDTTLINVDETENNYNFSLYPNPSTGSFSIKYDLKQSNDAVFKLYDIRGKLLNETVLKNENTSFDFSDLLANGIYFYQLSINNKMVKSDKVVIIK